MQHKHAIMTGLGLIAVIVIAIAIAPTVTKYVNAAAKQVGL